MYSKSSLILLSRRFFNSLHISGRVAEKIPRVVYPEIDIRARLQNEDIVSNIQSRKMEAIFEDSELEHLTSKLNRLESMVAQTNEMKIRRSRVYEKLKSDPDSSEILREKDEIDALITRHKKLKWDFEDSFIPTILSLPNKLNKETLDKAGHIIHSNNGVDKSTKYELKADEIVKSDIGLDYLSGRSASFELELASRSQNLFIDRQYQMIAGSDFVKPVVTDGCHYSEIATRFRKFDFDLVGSASLPSMVTFFIKTVRSKPHGCHLFSIGRHYDRRSSAMSKQSTVLYALSTCVNEEQMLESKRNLEETLKTLYDDIGIPYAFKINPASDLNPCESYKMSVNIEDSEVGYISLFDDYISKRLTLKTGKSPENFDNLYLVGGVALNITNLIKLMAK